MERGAPQVSVSRFFPDVSEERPPEEDTDPGDEYIPEETPSFSAEEFPEPVHPTVLSEEPASREPAPSGNDALPQPAVPDTRLWEKIRTAAIPVLPYDIRVQFEEGDRIAGRVDGNLLLLETQMDFLIKRFHQRPDVMQSLSRIASEVCGREMRVQIQMQQNRERAQRSLEELRQFKEVHFVSE